jgi:4'-phosphopantetheinyl transferase
MPAVCRWAVKVDNWHPEQGEWNFLLRLLSSEVRAEVQRYKFEADQRRCLVSKLLQRKCVRDVCSVPLSEINIQRTKGGKPFCANHSHPIAAPNFNFNVSHEVAHTLVLSVANSFSANCLQMIRFPMQGGYVVLAAEPVCICGIDVAAPPEARSAKIQSPAELFRAFVKQFTAEEVIPRWLCLACKDSRSASPISNIYLCHDLAVDLYQSCRK